MASRFVRPETVTIPISQGDSITIRKRLTAGEERDMVVNMANADTSLNLNKTGFAEIIAYLVDWTIKDDTGNIVSIRDKSSDAVYDVLRALDESSFKEILKAISDHVESMTKQREKEKNDQGGDSQSSMTSPLLDSVGGHSAKFVN